MVRAFGNAAGNALAAGFDGVEVHGANGYIIDQFLKSATNQRSDGYGGGVANRIRLLREIFEAVTSQVEPAKVGLRISPTSERKGMGDENPGALAEAVARLAQDFGLGYIHLIEPVAAGFMDMTDDPVIERVRSLFKGVLIQNGGFDGATADACIAADKADAVSFGRPYMANPDLVSRMLGGQPVAAPDFDYAYVGEGRGYTDYPRFGG